MSARPLGVTVLALASVVIGIYSLVASIALILGASIGAIVTAGDGAGAFMVGIIAFGLSFAAFIVGGGLWLQRHWAWAGGVVVFVATMVVSLGMAFIGGSPVATVAVLAASVAALVVLMRPSAKAAILRSPAT